MVEVTLEEILRRDLRVQVQSQRKHEVGHLRTSRGTTRGRECRAKCDIHLTDKWTGEMLWEVTVFPGTNKYCYSHL